MGRKSKSLAGLVATALLASFSSSYAQSNFNGDFETGNTLFSTEYPYTSEFCDTPGHYSIASNPADINCFYGFGSFGDHTTGSGLMMIVDGAQSDGTIIWSATTAVTPGTRYQFTFWATSVDIDNSTTSATLQAYINGKPVGAVLQLPPDYDGNWYEGKVNWNSRTKSQATIWIVDTNTTFGDNDFALDDLSLTPR